MSREAHAGICESRGVRLPPATRLFGMTSGCWETQRSLSGQSPTVLSCNQCHERLCCETGVVSGAHSYGPCEAIKLDSL